MKTNLGWIVVGLAVGTSPPVFAQQDEEQPGARTRCRSIEVTYALRWRADIATLSLYRNHHFATPQWRT